ncbi:MAG: efflux RND transporter periplasmic adaptor subunit [Myxococcales bacterium]|nr:efflux RND transporter periplasmic adaptor subunit [Myxococcales bacterium]
MGDWGLLGTPRWGRYTSLLCFGLLACCGKDVAAVGGDTKGVSGRQAETNGAPASVRVGEAVAGALNREIPCTGEMRADVVGVISPTENGRLDSLDISAGQAVVAGQVVALLDDQVQQRAVAEALRRITTAEARLSQAIADSDAKKAQVQRVKDLAAKNAYPAAQLAELVDVSKIADRAVTLARAQLEETKEAKRSAELLLTRRKVTAPFDGVVDTRHVVLGAMVGPQVPLADVYDPRSLYFSISIPEKNLPEVKEGTGVLVELDALGGQKSLFQVQKIGASVDPASRTIEVRAVASSLPVGAKPGMFGRCVLVLDSVADGVLVPAGAVDATKEGPRVWVVEDGKVNPVPVTVRLRTERMAAVVGIGVETQVVLSETNRLKPGAPVRVIP